MQEFSQRLKKLREEKGYSQRALSRILGIDNTTYMRYENDFASPSLDTLVKIAKHFKVSTDYLVGLEV